MHGIRNVKRSTAQVVASAFAVVAFVVLVVLASIYVPRWLAGPTGETEEIVAVSRGAYRIQGYEKFYNLFEDIGAIDVKLVAYPEAPLDDRQATECRGLLAKRANLVSEYNAAAKAERTIGQWRADNLPEELEQRNPRSC